MEKSYHMPLLQKRSQKPNNNKEQGYKSTEFPIFKTVDSISHQKFLHKQLEETEKMYGYIDKQVNSATQELLKLERDKRSNIKMFMKNKQRL